MSAMRSVWAAAVPAVLAAMLGGAGASPAMAQGDQPTLLGQYADWSAYTASPAGKKVCFALAKPKSSQTNPPNRPRDPAYLFISTRPAAHVRNDGAGIIGDPVKASTDATADGGPADSARTAQADAA